MALNRVLQTFLAWVVVAVVVVIAIVSFPDGQAWLQSLVIWQQHDPSAATVGQTGSDAAAAYNRLGNKAEIAGDDATAMNAYLQGEIADSRFVWNFVALGQIYVRLNRFVEADAQLRQAIKLAPRAQFLHYGLATVELHEARYAAAVRDFDLEAQISPKYYPAIQGRRQALEALHAEDGRVAAAQPTPTAVPSSAPSPTPAATRPPTATPDGTQPPTPTPAATRLTTPTPTPAATQLAAAPSPLPSSRPATLSAIQHPMRVPLRVSTRTASEARAYLLDISQDLNFTQVLPPADPNATTAELRQKLQALTRSPAGSEDEILRLGVAALLSGRLSLAATAFSTASGRAQDDWRGPYLAGLAARAGGDNEGARTFFKEANMRAARPEVYTSLAIVDLALGDDGAAAADAEQATSMNPSYGPGRFTAGMLALAHKNAAAARRNLSAASGLSGVPARSDYFLGFVSVR